MSALYDLSHKCPKCGTGHHAIVCSAPCVCRCRSCNARMNCRGEPEDWPKPLSTDEAKRRGMVLTSYGYVPASPASGPAQPAAATGDRGGEGGGV